MYVAKKRGLWQQNLRSEMCDFEGGRCTRVAVPRRMRPDLPLAHLDESAVDLLRVLIPVIAQAAQETTHAVYLGNHAHVLYIRLTMS